MSVPPPRIPDCVACTQLLDCYQAMEFVIDVWGKVRWSQLCITIPISRDEIGVPSDVNGIFTGIGMVYNHVTENTCGPTRSTPVGCLNRLQSLSAPKLRPAVCIVGNLLTRDCTPWINLLFPYETYKDNQCQK